MNLNDQTQSRETYTYDSAGNITYSPELARFINADVVAGSISNAITLNRYAYANGNRRSAINHSP